jgi:hypothetical protein
MNDHAHSELRSEVRSEAGLVFRWLILFPTFAVLVMLAANFMLGFFQWLSQLEGWLFILMLPVALVVALSNALASIIACMIAPRIRPAVVLLGIGHLAGILYGYWQFEWTALTAVVLIMHAVMVYFGLTVAYLLDLLHIRETAQVADLSTDSQSNPQTDPESSPTA